jgi:hypothetical protein
MSDAAEFATRRWGLGAGEKAAIRCSGPRLSSPQHAAIASEHLAVHQGISTESTTEHPIPLRDALGCELATETLRSFGQLRLRVNGASMLPAVWPGDILTVIRDTAAQALPGDIVLFGREGRLVAHRVVEVRKPQSEVRGPESEFRNQEAGSRIWDSGLRSRKSGASESRQAPIENRKSKIENAVSDISCPVSRAELITRGDSVEGNDPPISAHELLGRVVSLQRGSRTVVPNYSLASRLASWILRHSDLATRGVLKIRAAGFGIRGTGRKGWGLGVGS